MLLGRGSIAGWTSRWGRREEEEEEEEEGGRRRTSTKKMRKRRRRDDVTGAGGDWCVRLVRSQPGVGEERGLVATYLEPVGSRGRWRGCRQSGDCAVRARLSRWMCSPRGGASRWYAVVREREAHHNNPNQISQLHRNSGTTVMVAARTDSCPPCRAYPALPAPLTSSHAVCSRCQETGRPSTPIRAFPATREMYPLPRTPSSLLRLLLLLPTTCDSHPSRAPASPSSSPKTRRMPPCPIPLHALCCQP